MRKILVAMLSLGYFVTSAQEVKKDEITKAVMHVLDSINKVKIAEDKDKPKKEHWYDNIGIRGYVQVRYNGLLS
ncbi:MAG: porin, partial [Flavobacterium sp.]